MTTSELRTFTSESVTEGHPDKICDQISDAILDDMLSQDTGARVAVETMVTTGLVHVAGEVRTTGYSDVSNIVRDVIREIGYDSSEKGFDADSCGVEVSIGAQSPDIAQGVDTSFEARGDVAAEAFARLGAGDQGLMFGYACNDTPELMPLPIHAAHRLTQNLSTARRDGVLPYLRPDGKTQVSIGYDEDGVARSVEAVVVSTQHSEEVDLDAQLAPAISKVVIAPVLEDLAAQGLDVSEVVNFFFGFGVVLETCCSALARVGSTFEVFPLVQKRNLDVTFHHFLHHYISPVAYEFALILHNHASRMQSSKIDRKSVV